MPSPTDGANVEANSRGPLWLGKWALIFMIVWFILASLDVSPSLMTVVQASIARCIVLRFCFTDMALVTPDLTYPSIHQLLRSTRLSKAVLA
ncbi:hypothetical protein Tco_1420213 [Tanacetum coccineum]